MEDSEPDMEQIRRNILEKLRRRFAKMEQGNTKRFDRVLALWIDLQRAILSRKKSEDKLTDPKNLLALESLFYQLPEGPQMEMARKALQVCRDRSARAPAENYSKRTEREKP